MKKWVPLIFVTAISLFAIWAMPKDFTGVIGSAERINTGSIQEVALSSGWPAIVFMAAIITAFFLLNTKKKRKGGLYTLFRH